MKAPNTTARRTVDKEPFAEVPTHRKSHIQLPAFSETTELTS
jgi:hypothetical protein